MTKTQTKTNTRGYLIAGNWKMNHGPGAAAEFFTTLNKGIKTPSQQVRALIFPPSVSLTHARDAAQKVGSWLEIGSQNTHWSESGAFTGEISGPMLKELGIHWSLVGHSERRQYFGETDQTVNQRTKSLLKQGFDLILCVGETRAERERGETQTVLIRQLDAALQDIQAQAVGPLVIAYEPVWAIGTGLTATPQQAEDSHQIIRKWLWDKYGMEVAGRMPLLYGGSVTPQNVDALLASPNIDGALVGGASLKADGFIELLNAASKALTGV